MQPSSGINVLQKAGKSYVSLPSYHPVLINGSDPVKCLGDPGWAIVEGEVRSIVQVLRTPRMVQRYIMHEKYHDILTLPRELPADPEDHQHCAAIDELGDLSQFYRAEYDEPEPTYLDLDFQVIDKDCERVRIPDYVVVDFPANLEHYPETWHKYPCHIRMEKVFDIVWDRIVLRIAESGGKYQNDGYRNIQTMTITEAISIPLAIQHTRQVEIPPSGRARKTKVMTVTDTIRKTRILEIVGSYKQKGDAIQIQPVKGDDLADLMANLEDYVMSFLDILAPGRRQVCPHCKGVGVVAIGAEE